MQYGLKGSQLPAYSKRKNKKLHAMLRGPKVKADTGLKSHTLDLLIQQANHQVIAAVTLPFLFIPLLLP